MSNGFRRSAIRLVPILFVTIGAAPAWALECADVDPAPFASWCASVSLSSPVVRGDDTLTVTVDVVEDATTPCGAGGIQVSASYALRDVVVDGVATTVPDVWPAHASMYGYDDPQPYPLPGAVVPISGGHHTIVFAIDSTAITDCVQLLDYQGSNFTRQRLTGPWVVVGRGTWSTVVPFATSCIGTCGDGVIDERCEQCDPSGGSCSPTCRCENTCGNGVIEPPCEECDRPGGSCSSSCRCENTCGDGLPEEPCEECDLGARNGRSGSGCSSDCHILGRCAGTGADCATSADCGAGEGCCGNSVVEPGEECDDGNALDLDCCSSRCRIEPADSTGECDDGSTCFTSAECAGGGLCHRNCQPQPCFARGPHVVPAITGAFVATILDGQGEVSSYNTLRFWANSGRFQFPQGVEFAPASQWVHLEISEGDGPLWSAWMSPTDCPPQSSCFPEVSAGGCPTRWRFHDPEDEVFFARHLEKSLLVRQPKRSTGECTRKVRFKMNTYDDLFMSTPQGAYVRQTVEVLGTCATTILKCVWPNAFVVACGTFRP